MLPSHLVFVDVETTGGLPQRDRIIDIGIVRVEHGKVVDTFTSLVNPRSMLPPEISMLTGIESRDLERAPTFRQIQDRIKELMVDALFVAHNARFDASFIKSEFSRLDQTISFKTLCTAKLSRRLFPRFKRHNLDSIIERFAISCSVRHRALPDALVLWDFFQIIQSIFDATTLEEAYAFVTKSTALPPGVDHHSISHLPESAGVYIFYGEHGIPLYIGKSINIKERVLSHFYEFSHSSKATKVYQNISSVEAIPTSGELGALLLESSLIKKYQPLLNRQLRKSDRMIALTETVTTEGYFTIQRHDLSEISPQEVGNMLAIFKTERQVKETLQAIAAEYSLCQKILGLEKTKGKCFGSQIDLCHGACVGDEIPARYNMRFTQAFHKTRIKQWPFQSPILLEEGEYKHIVDHWYYKGVLDDSGTLVSNESMLFDYDTYKILSSYLLHSSKRRRALKITPFLQPSSDLLL